MIKKRLILAVSCLLLGYQAYTQAKYDTLVYNSDSTKAVKMMAYPLADRLLLYAKPKPFAFVTKFPRTLAAAAKLSFTKKSVPVWAGITVSTLALIAYDQKISDGVQQFSSFIGLDRTQAYKSVFSFKIGSAKIDAYDFPKNLNSVMYSMGEGSTSMVLAAGFSIYGLSKNDYRSRQTSSQIIQSQLALGVISQILKRAAGRESPSSSTASGGVWRPFTKPSVYQKEVSHYDAFPSGHLATMMATVIVIADNFPEKKWIKPVGFSLIGLTGFAMINNGVHWAGDYPLALGIGYVCGKAVVKMNRIVKMKSAKR